MEVSEKREQPMREVVVVSAARIPFGKFGGYLKDYSAVDLGTKIGRAHV
jgi:acetyl-CoA acetyltransferase